MASKGRVFKKRQVSSYFKCVIIVMLVSALLVFLYSLNTNNVTDCLKIFTISILISIASFVFGAAFGFLFGIPNQKKEDENALFEHNTSLKQISDWLTKIIIGVSLVELKSIFSFFKELVYNIDTLVIAENSFVVVIASLIIIFFIKGFLISYMLTVTNYPKELARRDNELKSLLNSDSIEKPMQMSETVEQEIFDFSDYEKNQALEVFQKRAELADASIARNAAKILFHNKQFKEAADLYDIAFKLDEKDITSRYNEAFIRSKFLKDFQRAKEILSKLIEADSSLVIPYYNLACNYAREYRALNVPDGDLEVRQHALRENIKYNLREVFKRDHLLLDEAVADKELADVDIDINAVFEGLNN